MINLNFNLFKTSGKWAYGGEVRISGQFPIYEPEELLAEIERNQNVVIAGTIVGRSYHLVIMETDAQQNDPDYKNFYTAMYPAKEE